MALLYILPVVALYALYLVFTQAVARFLLVPSQHWQDKIRAVLDHDKNIYLKAGAKRSSFRRRLVAASSQPSFYTNFVNNKLKVLPADKDNADEFMARMKVRDINDPDRARIYGFFHPYANNGGGGEKVLWHAVRATLAEDDRNIVAVYTTNTDAEPLQILAKASDKFGVSVDSRRVVFIYLRRYARLIDDSYWKRFTLAGQLAGLVLLAAEALYELTPDVWIDTMHLPGSYWLVAWTVKIPVVAYVHFPIVQGDMFSKLRVRSVGDLVRCSPRHFRDAAKFVYWLLLCGLYAYLGSCVDITLANGSWTFERIGGIWRLNGGKTVEILYPPCSTETLTKSLDTSAARVNKLLYLAQFRPEKRHLLVVEEYSRFVEQLRMAKLPVLKLPTLVFLGSCRTPHDLATLDQLREQVAALGLEEYVEFDVDRSFEEVKARLAECKFGLNAMWNEHFGISVVEYLSAGCIPIVHASAGPWLDIVEVDDPATSWQNELGFFFKSETDPDYAGGKKNGELEFALEDQSVTFPTLAQVLVRLFIEEPELLSDASLESKRILGAQLMLEKFSDDEFATQWTGYVRAAAALEAEYRELRRDKVDAVY